MQNSAAHEHHVEESSSGTDRDPDPSRRLTFHTSSIKHSRLSTKAEKAKGTAQKPYDVAFLSAFAQFFNFQTHLLTVFGFELMQFKRKTLTRI